MIRKQLSNGRGEIVINNDILEGLKRGLGKAFETHVGILGNKTNRSAVGKEKNAELTNAELGAIHEFGVRNEKTRMPQRSFLAMPLRRNAKELFEKRQKLQQYLNKAIENGTPPEEAWRKAHEELGIVGEQIVQGAFEQSGPGWAKLKPATIARKKSDKILIDSAQLRRSVTSRVVMKK